METPTASSRTDYINNPFTIAVRGLNLLFLNAQNVAIFLIILAVLNYLPNARQTPASTQGTMPSLEAVIAALPVIITVAAIVLVVLLIVAAIINGICGYTIARISHGQTVTFSDAIKGTFARFGDVVWLQFLMAIKLLGWTLLGIVPGFIMTIRYTFAMPVLFDKDLTGNAAIKQSIALSRRSWITTFGGLTVFNIITFGIISPLIQTASSAILYRQFNAVPNDERPAPHGLSIAVLVITIMAVTLGVLGVIGLAIYGVTHGWFNHINDFQGAGQKA